MRLFLYKRLMLLMWNLVKILTRKHLVTLNPSLFFLFCSEKMKMLKLAEWPNWKCVKSRRRNLSAKTIRKIHAQPCFVAACTIPSNVHKIQIQIQIIYRYKYKYIYWYKYHFKQWRNILRKLSVKSMHNLALLLLAPSVSRNIYKIQKQI